MSYDEHKEARLELAEARAEIYALKRDVAGQTRSAQNGWRTADTLRAERDVLRAQVQAVRALADRGVGTDVTPTVSGREDVGWWYAYLRDLDNPRWEQP